MDHWGLLKSVNTKILHPTFFRTTGRNFVDVFFFLSPALQNGKVFFRPPQKKGEAREQKSAEATPSPGVWSRIPCPPEELMACFSTFLRFLLNTNSIK